jgi:hypothetical protein
MIVLDEILAKVMVDELGVKTILRILQRADGVFVEQHPETSSMWASCALPEQRKFTTWIGARKMRRKERVLALATPIGVCPSQAN